MYRSYAVPYVSYIAFLTSVVSEIKHEIVSELIRNILHKSAPAISKDSRNLCGKCSLGQLVWSDIRPTCRFRATMAHTTLAHASMTRPLWRMPDWRRSSMTQDQYGAFHYGAAPV